MLKQWPTVPAKCSYTHSFSMVIVRDLSLTISDWHRVKEIYKDHKWSWVRNQVFQGGLLLKLSWRGSLVGLSGKESICQCRRHGVNPWSRKIPHAVEQLSPGAATSKPEHPRTRALQQEARTPQLESGPCLPQREKSPRSNRDPGQPNIKIINKTFKN